ncbi:hypothetical protein GGR52DRAFT_576239 [Hypoxylon sp. FL1284]|nr:hypothetical protein GGR52DRAFT_576239 [Hypoxylon sp. FL1284]
MSIPFYEPYDSQDQLNLSDRCGHRASLLSTSTTAVSYDSTIPRVISPSPESRGLPPRSDRLSLRLRSNSGMSLHTNMAALSQYTDYNKDSLMRPYSSIYDMPLHEGEVSPSLQDVSWYAGDGTPSPSFPESVDAELFQRAMDDPVIARSFRDHCKEQGCEGDFEFLTKVRNFSESTNEMASILTAISTSFIMVGATHSLNLPPMVSRALNVDVRRVAHTIIPSLEAVFSESKSHIEHHMVTTIFPDFVKRRLMDCTAMALSLGSSSITSYKPEFPGLGKSLCIIEPSGSAITAATDAFLAVIGYPLHEAVLEQYNFLRGLHADAVVGQGQEAVGLLRNRREESWNLCFIYPLRDHEGELRCWLGAAIDVSDSVRGQDNLMRILDYTSYPDPTPSGGVMAETRSVRERSLHSREGSRGSDSRSRFLQQLRKPQQTPLSALVPESDYIISSVGYQSARDKAFLAQRFQPRPRVPISLTTYSYRLLLGCNSSHVLPTQQRQPAPSGSRKKQSLKLHIIFYSDEAANILSIRDDVTYVDVFRVLEDKARSPSITKSFKSTIRERLACGKSISAEIMVDTNPRPNTKQKGVFGTRTLDTADWDRPKSQGVGRFDKKSTRGFKQERLISHWTPLRNVEGTIENVVLILMPQI